MSGRRWLLWAFPRSWRARFGDQLGHLLDDMEEEAGKIRAGDQLDVARAGLTERLRQVGRHRRALLGCGIALSVAAAAALTALQFAGVPASQSVRPPAPASSTTHPESARPTAAGHTTPIQTAQKNAAAEAAAQQAAVQAQVAAQAAAAARAATEAEQAAQTARDQAAAQVTTEAASQSPSHAVAVSGTAQ
jgi:hypothetical protein